MKILFAVILAIALTGCATHTSGAGGSEWDEWSSRLKKDTPAKTGTQGRVQDDTADWTKHSYAQP